MKTFTTITLLIVTLILAGCGSGNVPLGGRVTFEDGTPLTAGTVAFISADGKHQALGEIGADGRFDLGFTGVKDGLPKGEYGISVMQQKVTVTQTGNAERYRIEHLLDEKFGSPATSGLTCNVDGSGKTFDITVSKPEKPQVTEYLFVPPPAERK